MKGLRVGIVRQHFDEGLDEQCGTRVKDAIAVLESMGATIVDVDLPNLDLSVPTYYVVAPAECSSNLSDSMACALGIALRCRGSVRSCIAAAEVRDSVTKLSGAS